MNIQIGDIWEDEKVIREVLGKSSNGFGHKYTIKESGKIHYNDHSAEFIMIGAKLTSRMVGDKRVYRPVAGEKCTLDECLLFGICTEEEFNSVATNGIVVLDFNGELPKPKKEEPKVYVDYDVRYFDGELIYEGSPARPLYEASSKKGFMGFVWDCNGKEFIDTSPVLFRGEDDILHWQDFHGKRTLEYCKAVRYKV